MNIWLVTATELGRDPLPGQQAEVLGLYPTLDLARGACQEHIADLENNYDCDALWGDWLEHELETGEEARQLEVTFTEPAGQVFTYVFIVACYRYQPAQRRQFLASEGSLQEHVGRLRRAVANLGGHPLAHLASARAVQERGSVNVLSREADLLARDLAQLSDRVEEASRARA